MNWQGNKLFSADGEISYKLRYDDRDPGNRGWFAEYTNAVGDVCYHSELVTHPDMPRRRDAEKAATRIARRVARELLK